ncbi:MAG: hypothetical protein ACTSQE_12950 [Candidatus Heimdallarchaeaceae archaeon]
MVFLLQKLSKLFRGAEKNFIQSLHEQIEEQRYVNLRKIDTKLSLNQRVEILQRLKSKGDVTGIYLPSKFYFFSISDAQLGQLKHKLNNEGKLEINSLKKIWAVKNTLILEILRRFGAGFLGKTHYYSTTYLSNSIQQELQKNEEYDLEKIVEMFDLKLKDVQTIVNKLISDHNLDGVIQNDTKYLSKEVYEEVISEYIEESRNKNIELEFDKIAEELKLPIVVVERYLLQYAKKNPNQVVVYPIEKKIQFKG